MLEYKNYIKEGFETINLHFNREPRFYGAIYLMVEHSTEMGN